MGLTHGPQLTIVTARPPQAVADQEKGQCVGARPQYCNAGAFGQGLGEFTPDQLQNWEIGAYSGEDAACVRFGQ